MEETNTASEAPVESLDSSERDHETPPKREPGGFFAKLGPGLVTGAADDDPSGVATYAQAGAAFGYGMLWTVPLSYPLMAATQEICDRTALTTGDSLGSLVRKRFARGARLIIGVLTVALIVANCLNIAADLAAIGQGMQMLHAGSDHVWVVITGVGLSAALIGGSFERIAMILKWLCAVLLVYVVVLWFAHVDWAEVGRGLIGARMSWSWKSAALTVAVLGTSISPYMFFWESADRVEEMRAEHGTADASLPLPRRRRRHRYLQDARIDVFVGMAMSVIVMFAIITASAATIGRHGSVDIGTAAEAAAALQPVAGQASSTIFAIGFIASGLLAVPVLSASGSVALAGLLGKPWGLNRSASRAPLFYLVVLAGIIGGSIIAVFSHDVIGLLVFSAIVNGIAAAPCLLVTMLIAGDTRLMGRYRNRRLATVLGWTTVAIMGVAGVVGVLAMVHGT